MSPELDQALMQLLLDARPRIREILEMTVTEREDWEGGLILSSGGRAAIATGETVGGAIGGTHLVVTGPV